MAAVAFDTLKFTQTLEQAGVERNQATAIATAVRDAHETADIATKNDIRTLEASIREAELRIVIKLGGLMIVGFGALATILKL